MSAPSTYEITEKQEILALLQDLGCNNVWVLADCDLDDLQGYYDCIHSLTKKYGAVVVPAFGGKTA